MEPQVPIIVVNRGLCNYSTPDAPYADQEDASLRITAPVASHPSPLFEKIMTGPNEQRIQQYIKDLCQNDRYIVLLYYADGLTPPEIASVLELESSHVDRQLNFFRAQFRGLMEQANPTTHAVA